MNLTRTRLAAACAALVLGIAGCGGGGSSGSGDPGASTAQAPSDNLLASGSGAGSTSAASGSSTAPAPTTGAAPAPATSLASAPVLGDCEMFPANAVFNTRIDDASRFPAHARSADWVNLVGPSVPFWGDWGINENPADYGSYWGLPVNVVDGTPATTEWPVVSFDFSTSGVFMDRGYPHRSDCAVPDGNGGYNIGLCEAAPASQRRFPFPLASQILKQGGNCNDPNSCGDRHVLVVEKGACRLWESWFSYNLSGQWYSMATAAWNLKSLSLRPWGWNSASAAGLPITPFLAKAKEASSGEIKHALSVGFRASALSLNVAWPARFAAGGSNAGGIPFGALLRLKADFVIPSSWTPQAKALATAAKRYGLYVMDIGADFHVGGDPNATWDPRTHADLRGISMSNMEFVDLGAVMNDPRFSPDSMAGRW